MSAQWFSQRYHYKSIFGCAIAFVRIPQAFVCIGLPVGPKDKIHLAMKQFSRFAKTHKKRVVWFGAESLPQGDFRHELIGSQPLWKKGQWNQNLKAHPSLRAQLRRSLSKNLDIVKAHFPLEEPTSIPFLLQTLIKEASQKRNLAPMSFLVGGLNSSHWVDKTLHLATLDSKPVAALVIAPTPNGKRLLVEHIIRTGLAPNGAIERLFDSAIQDFERSHAESLSFGLAPLRGKNSAFWKQIKKLGRPFYNFEGLETFKSKLRPSCWEPQYLVYDKSSNPYSAFHDVLRAFSGDTFTSFAYRTLKLKSTSLLEKPKTFMKLSV